MLTEWLEVNSGGWQDGGEGWLRKAAGRSKRVFEAGLQSARLMQIIDQPSFMEYGHRRLNVDMQRYLFTILRRSSNHL